MSSSYVFVSESVTRGHPDKLCDQISDALVDAYLKDDAAARIDAECAVANGIVFIGAHYNTDSGPDVSKIARGVIESAGYTEGDFNHRDCAILTSLSHLESMPRRPALTGAPDEEQLHETVALHQATVFGHACRQTPELMPLPIVLAHCLARKLDQVRASRTVDYLGPDAKTQVAVEYCERRPERIHTISLTTSADPDRVRTPRALSDDLIAAVIEPVIAVHAPGKRDDLRLLVNHREEIRKGGPAIHSGLTGRKTAVDTYGEYARHSGAALSGKDPLRIDRLGAYAARHAAKNAVAAGLADECEVQLSYTIGLARPVSLHVETFGTGAVHPDEIAARIREHFDLRPLGMLLRYAPESMIQRGDGFRRLAVYGHVGRDDLGLPWEELDMVDALAG